jgi:hypothetical protein
MEFEPPTLGFEVVELSESRAVRLRDTPEGPENQQLHLRCTYRKSSDELVSRKSLI